MLKDITADSKNEDLIDTLTAISVVAKHLAAKLRRQTTKGGKSQNGDNERITDSSR